MIDSPDSSLYGAEKAVASGTGAAEEISTRAASKARRTHPKGRNVNKAQLIDAVAEKLEISRRAAGEAVDAVLDGITGAVVSGDKVSLTGFGTFESARRPARVARNPRTGDQVRVAAATVPKFRAGQAFKDEVNGTRPAARKTAAKKTAAKKSVARKAAATSATAAKRTATSKTAATARKAAPAKKAATATRKTAATRASNATTKKAAVTKAAAKTTAKKTATTKGAARPMARKSAVAAPATKTAAKKTVAKKSTVKKSGSKKR